VKKVPLGEFMPSRVPALNPAKFQDEEFELWSIPAFDLGEPERLTGSEIGSPKKCVQPKDVLLSRIVPHIRRSWIVGQQNGYRQIASGEWIIFRSSKFFPPYLRHVLISDDFHARFMQTVAGVGGSLLRARPEGVKEIEIPLPPLEEQKRIAAILDQADSLRRLRQRAIDRLNTLGQAIFYEMFGITTQEPRSDVAQPRVACALGDQITLQRGKDITERQAIAGPVPVISSGGISFYHDKPLVEGPGVILGRKGSVGKVHYVEKDYWPHDTTLYVKEFNGNIPFFVYYFFLQFPISDYEASAANPSLNRNNLHPVKVWWPAIDEQLRFKERIELLKHHGEILEVSIKTLEDLFSSLQHRAFRGEL
jgi:type I restriction enzyme, S subunit